MTAPVYQAAGAFHATAGGITVQLPTHQTDDVFYLIVETANQAATLSIPANFTELSISPKGTGTAGAVNATRLTVFRMRCTSGAMGNPQVADAGDHIACHVIQVRGAINTGNPEDVMAGDTASSSTSATIPGATTTGPDRLVICILASGKASTSPQISGWTNANLTGLTERLDSFTGSGVGGGFGVATGVKATAGAIGNTTATLANAAAQARIMIAVKPPDAAGGGGGSGGSPRTDGGPDWKSNGDKVATAGSATALLPSYVVGDIAIVWVKTANQSLGSLPTGWAYVGGSAPGGTGTAGAAGAVRLIPIWKRMVTLSEAHPVLGDAGDHTIAAVMMIKDAIESGDPFDGIFNDVQAGSDTSVEFASITTSVDGCLILYGVASATDTTTPQVSGYTNANLTNLSERMDNYDNIGVGGGFGVATGVKATAGAIGAGTATLATSSAQARFVFAIKPKATSPGPGDPALPHQHWKMELTNTPGAGPDVTEVEIDIRDQEAGGTSRITAPAKAAPGVTHLRPMFAVNQPDGVGGVFDIDFFYMTLPAGYSPDRFTDEVRRRGDTFYDTDGHLRPDVVQFDGVRGMPLIKGLQSGTGRHGDQVTFGVPYQSVPDIEIDGGLPNQPESRWTTNSADASADSGSTAPTANAAQLPDYAALNPTPAGFKIRARLRQPGSAALQTNSFAATQLDTIDETVTVTLASAPSNDDNYSVGYQGTISFKSSNGTPYTVSLHFAIETNDGSGWVTRSNEVLSYTTTSLVFVTQTNAGGIARGISVSGLDSSDQVRLRLTAITTQGLGTYASAYVQGLDVNYFTSTDKYASKTPANYPDAKVKWSSKGYL